MVAIKSSRKVKRSEAEGADDSPCAVATITRLIHVLYAPNGSYVSIGKGRDGGLIKWSEVVGAVRGRYRPRQSWSHRPPRAASPSTRRSPTPS